MDEAPYEVFDISLVISESGVISIMYDAAPDPELDSIIKLIETELNFISEQVRAENPSWDMNTVFREVVARRDRRMLDATEN